MRDLLTVLGIDKVTVIGHSFGGGVAMQFAYQFPERTERLMLVVLRRPRPRGDPGDPGDHHARLPRGDGRADPARRPPRRHRRACARSRPCGWKSTRDLDEVAAVFDTFKDPAARHAIRHVVRAVVDWHGQIVTMADRAYLTEEMPMWVVWGRDDRVIPVRHASQRRPRRAERARRGDPRRRALPAQGPPRTASAGSCTTSSARPSRRSTPAPGSGRCSRTARESAAPAPLRVGRRHLEDDDRAATLVGSPPFVVRPGAR